MCRGNRKRDVSTMVTYSHASTPLGQSERAYYLSYFIKVDTSLFSKRVPRLLWALTWFGANLKTRKQRRQGYCYLRGFSSISLPPNLHTCMLGYNGTLRHDLVSGLHCSANSRTAGSVAVVSAEKLRPVLRIEHLPPAVSVIYSWIKAIDYSLD